MGNQTDKFVDEFYPMFEKDIGSMAGLGLAQRIQLHLDNAKNGDRLAESKLMNRIGQVKRSFSFDEVPVDIQDLIKEAVEYLRSTGRKVNLGSSNPEEWFTTRSGQSRFN